MEGPPPRRDFPFFRFYSLRLKPANRYPRPLKIRYRCLLFISSPLCALCDLCGCFSWLSSLTKSASYSCLGVLVVKNALLGSGMESTVDILQSTLIDMGVNLRCSHVGMT